MCIVVSSIGCGTIIKRYRNARRRRGSRRRRITTRAENRCMLQCARRQRTLTAGQQASQLSVAAGRPISRQTVQRRLHKRGQFARRPVVCAPLSPECGCIGPVNIAVGYQCSGFKVSLRMSPYLTSRTSLEGYEIVGKKFITFCQVWWMATLTPFIEMVADQDQVAECRIRDRRFVVSIPDSKKDPPCEQARCTLNLTMVNRPLASVDRRFAVQASSKSSDHDSE
ncbi:hypothetical protein AVEN_3220-1 [Araneus ventricosus]|uniref:Transposase Tc1-like domain-containing protein n=1 Tax=Araneus ventricosus TaxID=182803 RepID=A0A4Y2G8E4_ARAVE|nr:hypothetical protein AVEN_3220-1 [Araneus ventricosus]